MSDSAGPVQLRIESELANSIELLHLEVINESHMHNVPPNSETHFKVVLVAAVFEGMRPVARHQMIYKSLQAELDGPVHALALHTFTPSEWTEKNAQAPLSPPCLGGSKS